MKMEQKKRRIVVNFESSMEHIKYQTYEKKHEKKSRKGNEINAQKKYQLTVKVQVSRFL